MKSVFLAMALTIAAPLQAAEWRPGVGVFEQSRWQLGLRALRYTGEWETSAGTSLSKAATIQEEKSTGADVQLQLGLAF
jgi:hypothetical protein